MYAYWSAIITLGITSTVILAYRRCCPQYEDDGYYCQDDLSGYYNCIYEGDSWCLRTGGTVKCPSDTRCSCYIDHWCKGNTSSICVPYETPAPFEESFSLTFHRLRNYESLNPHVYKHYNETSSGFVVRDGVQKKYLWNDGDQSKLVYQDETGQFIQYSWKESEPGQCRRYNVGFLPYVTEAKDFHKYTLLSSNKAGIEALQKWYFQKGRQSWMFNFYKMWWTVSYDYTTNRILPVEYFEKHIGDEMADYTIYTTIRWKVDKELIHTDLRIPSFCA